MAPQTVAGIVEAAADAWTFSNDIEVTLEANPTSVEAQKFRDFRSAGINRVSIGIQALNDIDLRKLGRTHSAEEGLAAIKIAQTVFDRSSFDLIYARQDQSLKGWQDELGFALELAAEHLSLYQLTVEPGTVFGARHEKGLLAGLPPDDLAADMYLLTQDMTDEAGLPAYEISNHARCGAESRHNLVYWECGDYVGVGPGAHGRLSDALCHRQTTVSLSQPQQWLEAVEVARSGEIPRDVLTPMDQANELLLMGLRLTRGIDVAHFETLSGHGLPSEIIQNLVSSGHLTHDHSTIRATKEGRLLLNSILRALLT